MKNLAHSASLDSADENAPSNTGTKHLAQAKARGDLDRARQLRERGVISVAQFERDTFTFDAAQRDVTAAERRLHAAAHILAEARSALRKSAETGGVNVEKVNVTAPVSGRVLRVLQENEAIVSAGAALLEIGDPADIEVIVDVLTADAIRIPEDANVRIEHWGGVTALAGRVRRIEPSGFTKTSALGVEEQRVWVIIEITSPREEWRNLSDAFRVDVSIIVDDLADAIIVPAGALFRREESWFAFVVRNERVIALAVDIQRRSGRFAAVASGLAPGDKVVVYPPSSLSEGSLVRALH